MNSSATRYLYQVATGRDVEAGDKTCVLCGETHADSVDVEEVLRDTYTNHGLCRAPHSRDVCRACSWYFNHRWPVGQKYESEYRKHSMRLTDCWHSWQRAEMRADLEHWLRDGFPGGVLVVALSKKKHCLPLARVNPPGRSFTVQVEEERVQVSGSWLPLAAAFDGLLALGLSKGNILSGQYHHAALRRADLSEVLRLDRVIAPWRPSGLLTLISYVTLLEDDDAPTGD